MNTNLDKIALDLYGKIQTRFPNIKIGDESGEVLSKKADIPHARFFEFDYKEQGVSLGTVAITLDEDDGVVVEISGDLADSKHPSAFKFFRSFRQFAKDRLLNFDIQNIGKDSLDKRDYNFKAKHKEIAPMEPIMENKMYGTSKISYQDLGEARLVVKHSQPVNLDLAAGRTMHIESIYVENSQGERFKYPVKHLNGARALAEHLKAGGIPYDAIGKHITSLSEELAQLRKFKGYVNRNEALSEAMGGITDVVFNRIEENKKEVNGLQRPAYYQAFAESFKARDEQMIPEEIMSDFIDRLTIRTFNEDLRTAFPYIFRLIDESEIPVRELTPDDLLDEGGITLPNPDGSLPPGAFTVADQERLNRMVGQRAAQSAQGASGPTTGGAYPPGAPTPGQDAMPTPSPKPTSGPQPGPGSMPPISSPPNPGSSGRPLPPNPNGRPGEGRDLSNFSDDYLMKAVNAMQNGVRLRLLVTGLDAEAELKRRGVPIPDSKPQESYDPEMAFESFIESIVAEDELSQDGEDTLFSPNKSTQQAAIEKFNDIMSTELKGGPEGINIIDSLKGLIDDPDFLDRVKDLDPDLDARSAIQQELNFMAKDNADIARILPQLNFAGDGEIGGEELPPEEPAADASATPPAPEAPPADASATPPAPDAGAEAGAVPPAPEGEQPVPPPVAEAYNPNSVDAEHRRSLEKSHEDRLKKQADGGDESAKKRLQALHDKKERMRNDFNDRMERESIGNPNMAKLKAKFIQAKESGATLEHEMDFGHKVMTLHDAMRECGLTPMECGFGDQQDADEHQSGVHQMLSSVAGFWNREQKNFTIGGTRAKTKVVKSFKDGEFPNASQGDLEQVLKMIDKMDPSHGDSELGRIKQLAGNHNHAVGEDSAGDERDFSSMMKNFLDSHNGVDVNQMLANFAKSNPDAKITQSNTSSGTINGKPASYDDAMKQMPKIKFGDQEFDTGNPQAMQGQIGNMMKGMMGKAQMPDQNIQFPGGQMNPQDMMKGIMSKMPGMNEDAELTAMLKIAGLR